MNLIEVQNLFKNYRSGSEEVNAVNDVSFQIAQGDFATIMGPSGSGKSTLLTMLGGLTKPTSGNVLVDSINISDLSSNQIADFRREYIGFVFQSFQLIPYLTVVENIMLPLILKNEQHSIQKEKANTILQKVGLENKAHRLVEQLSGGEQQRVAIARAIVNDPLIILADEPTGNLDTKTGYEILELFTHLNNEGKTIIIVTHNNEFKDLTDYTLLFKDGRLSDKILNVKDNWDTPDLKETWITIGN